MYEVIDCNTYLIITSLSAIDNARPLYAFIRLQIRSLIKEKTYLVSLSITEGNSRYFPVSITCRTPIMRDKSSCVAPLILQLKNTSGFDKLISCPDDASYVLRILSKRCASTTLALKNKKQSSAHNRWDTTGAPRHVPHEYDLD